jgi:hypothetical protein
MSETTGAGRSSAHATKLVTPPYLPYATFKNFLGDLQQTVVPNQIDAGVMRSKSGSDQSGIRVAMKFFGLTNEDGSVKDRLRSLVTAHGTNQWKPVWGSIVKATYQPIVGDLDLEKGTGSQLAELFRERADISPHTLSKSIRFYLSCLDDLDIRYSTYLKPPRAPKPTKQRVGGKAPKDVPPTPPPARDEGMGDPSPEMVVHPFHLPKRDKPVLIKAFKDMTAKEWKMVNDFMRAYVGAEDGPANA